MKPTVYLAGPISGLSYDGAVDWRETVARQLADVGIRALSPMRAKSYLKARGTATLDSRVDYRAFSALSSHRGITVRDRWDATRCDVMLVNVLGARIASIGTAMEVAWADDRRTPIVCAIEPAIAGTERPGPNPHDHGMFMDCIGFRVPTLDEAVDIVKALLL
jgi:hypothetical protein